MKAAVLRGRRKLVVEEVPEPRPGPTEVLIKMKHCGICGSDLHSYEHPLTPPGCIMGHEWVGEVAELGPEVAGWSVGDRVWPGGSDKFPGFSWKPEYGWDTATLFRDDPVKDMGGYGEYAAYHEGALCLIPPGVSDIEACMADQAATALGALHASRLQIGESVLVIGAGPIGLWTLRCCQLAGARVVGVAELVGGRRKVADRMGADLVVDSDESDVRERLADYFDGVGPDVVMECGGTATALRLAIDVVRRDGRIALVGISNEAVALDSWKVYIKGAEMKAVNHIDYPGGMDLIRRKRVDCAEFLTEIIPLEMVPDAFEALLNPVDQVKMVVGY